VAGEGIDNKNKALFHRYDGKGQIFDSISEDFSMIPHLYPIVPVLLSHQWNSALFPDMQAMQLQVL
jgi:hypothetical protein